MCLLFFKTDQQKYLAVILATVADQVLFRPLYPGWKNPDPGWTSRIIFSESLETIFWAQIT